MLDPVVSLKVQSPKYQVRHLVTFGLEDEEV